MPAQRGDALKWMFWLSNTLHPTLRMWFYPHKYIEEAAVPALSRATQGRLSEYFAHLEAHAGWLDDRAPSALACYLAPMIRWAAIIWHPRRRGSIWTNTPAFARICDMV